MMKVTEQGLATDKKQRYRVVPRTLIFLTSINPQDGGREVLLIKGAPTKRLWANRYNGVGGHVEWNEDILQAAQRELYEESGLIGVDLKLRGVINIAAQPEGNAPAGVIVFLFCAETEARAIRAGDEGESAWVPLADLQNYPLVDDLYTLIPLLMADEAPIYGHYQPAMDGTLRYRFNRNGE
ncbi:MAG: NUDIX domain-containing protein [Caldilineaceae bacterium]|nr:NUDIX domain-containing protein [Caldilineaceae bacterium]